MALQSSGQFQFKQGRAHDGRWGIRHPNQIVEPNRRGTKQGDDARTVACGRLFGPGAAVLRFFSGQIDRPSHDRPHGINDVGCLGNQSRALLDEIISAGSTRIERRVRHGENLAALLGGDAGGDQ